MPRTSPLFVRVLLYFSSFGLRLGSGTCSSFRLRLDGFLKLFLAPLSYTPATLTTFPFAGYSCDLLRGSPPPTHTHTPDPQKKTHNHHTTPPKQRNTPHPQPVPIRSSPIASILQSIQSMPRVAFTVFFPRKSTSRSLVAVETFPDQSSLPHFVLSSFLARSQSSLRDILGARTLSLTV